MIEIFKKFFIIAKYNFLDTIKKPFFKLFTIISTLFILIGIFLPDFIAKSNIFNKKDQNLIYIVDTKNYIFDNHLDLNLFSSNIKDLIDGEYYFKLLEKDSTRNYLDVQLSNGEIDGYLYINGEADIDVVTLKNYPDLKFILDRFILRKNLRERFGFTDYELKKFDIDYNVKYNELNKDKIKKFLETYTLPVIFMLFIYIVFIMYGQIISINTNVEKNSKIIEVFLTKSNLSNIILGKVFGILFSGIIQIIYFVSLLFLVVNLLSYENFPIIKSLIKFDFVFVCKYFVYFILGFILYGFMFLLAGNMVKKTEDLSVGIIPIVSLISLGYFFAIFSLQFPQNYLINLLRYVPFFTPFIIISNNLSLNFFDEILMLNIMILSVVIVILININTFRSVIRFRGNKD